MNVTDEILALFHRRGDEAYFGENVSTTEHCLQAAYFAQTAAAPAGLIVAALLHDIGHLIEDVPNDIADWTVDAHHERVASRACLGEDFNLLAVHEPELEEAPLERGQGRGGRAGANANHPPAHAR